MEFLPCPPLPSALGVEEQQPGSGGDWGHLLEITKDSGHEQAGGGRGLLPTHTRSHLGLLTPDPADGIRSDLVPHLLSQVLGSLNGIQSLEGEKGQGCRQGRRRRPWLVGKERQGGVGLGRGRAWGTQA